MLLHSDIYNNFSKLLVESKLGEGAYGLHPCGYITESGSIFHCEPYQHLSFLERVVNDGDYFQKQYEEFSDFCFKHHIRNFTNKSIYDEFALMELGWVKIAAYGVSGKCEGDKKNWIYD